MEGDFPGGPLVKNLLSNSRDTGLIPSWGTETPHAMGERTWDLSSSTEIEPVPPALET